MAEPDKKSPFYERRTFQGAVAVIGLLTAVWALTGAPRPWSVATKITAVETPLANTEVVLVADKSMKESFDGTTKMDAAVEAIRVIGRDTSNQGLALRRAGKRCGEPGEQVIGFGSHHGDDIEAAAEDVVPSGQADLSNAVNGALDDLEDPDLNQPGSRKGVVVFLGGKDECDKEAISDVRREIEAHGVSPQFKIIALVDTKKEKTWVDHLEAGLRPWDVDVVEATTRAEVKKSAAEAIKETAAGSGPGAAAPTPEPPGEQEDEEADSQAEGRSQSGVDGPEEEEISPEEGEEEEGEEEGEVEESEEVEPGGGEEEAGEAETAPAGPPPPSSSGESAEGSEAAGTSGVARPLPRRSGYRLLTVSRTVLPPSSTLPPGSGAALITEPWPWWTTIG